MIHLKRLWWAIKVALFPHTDRRAKVRPRNRASHAEDMLATAIIDLTKAIEGKK